MLGHLDHQKSLTRNQARLIGAAIAGNILDFFDLFLISFVLAFIVKPWGLTFGESALVLLSSGVGAMIGAMFWGWLADRIGRRLVFSATIANFALATGAMALTPDGAWVYLAIMRFLVGFGAGGLYCVDLPLVQEFVPVRLRGRIGGLVTAAVPAGLLLASLAAATLTDKIGWRGLFVVGMAPAFLVLLARAWVPESPRWLLSRGRTDLARRSIAWALNVAPESLPALTTPAHAPADQSPARLRELGHYPRSLAASWITNLGIQTGHYGFTMWAPTLLVLILQIPPSSAAWYMAAISLGGLAGRFLFAWLSDSIGRRSSGVIFGLGAAVTLSLASFLQTEFLGPLSLFWVTLIAANIFIDGGFAIVGPYAAEVWPSRLRTTGMGTAYGFGGIGKIIGPMGLAWIIGSSNVVTPQATIQAIVPAFLYLAAWFVLAGAAFLVLGIETKGRSIEDLDRELQSEQGFSTAAHREHLKGEAAGQTRR
ncbi:MFS transporter [Bradyrhizobium septentrionale]|uniref:MFS transporter n=1 Tax=Bradyrhizobium septentrionale TaxID=1404411 RepID=A0ABZ2NXE4_9BRAD